MRWFWLALLVSVAAPAQPVGEEMSPRLSWDPYNEQREQRQVSAAAIQQARERGEAWYSLLRSAPSFQRSEGYALLGTSLLRRREEGLLNQAFVAYWSRPSDVRRRPDGSLAPVLGGAHQLLYFDSNWQPRNEHLVDTATRGDFSRDDARYFAAPRVFGNWAGGTVYGDMLVWTRDGRSALSPAPLGPLLEFERARLTLLVKQNEEGFAARRAQLAASMTPEAVAQRRARREAAWQRETRDPQQMSKRLDAAARSDESSAERELAFNTAPATPDPRSPHWTLRLALQAAEAQWAALDPGQRQAATCARTEPGFTGQLAVRYQGLEGAPADCVPMVQLRADLLDPRRPEAEVQLFTIWFREGRCGERWKAAAAPSSNDFCTRGLALLREMDGAALRKVLGWPAVQP